MEATAQASTQTLLGELLFTMDALAVVITTAVPDQALEAQLSAIN